jgi:C-terminal processing protease CtpA/Prc
MGAGSLQQLYLDLDTKNRGKVGVVVDIRANNGGFVNPYAIDVLARRGYLQFTPRDFGTAPGRSVVGQRSLERPTVLVTNMHSLSDAEDFTEGYRSLKLGPVVGEPTAGWIIFTSNVPLLDGSSVVRMPFERITDANGKDMELHPRPVDVFVQRPVGESYTGRDSQLDAAVKALLEKVGVKP